MDAVRWHRIGLFYGLALGWVTLVAVVVRLVLASVDLGSLTNLVYAATIAVFYMLAPLAAALVVERLDGRRPLITTTFAGFGRRLPRLLLAGVATLLGLVLSMLGVSWLLGTVLGIPLVGRLITDRDELIDHLIAISGGTDLVPRETVAAQVPGVWALLGLVLVQALVAGFTVNAVFAFGEEYGWRGWLMDELRPLGAVRANLLTGVLWGLWHAPIIMLFGHNYAPHNLVGPLFMVVVCIPLSFLFWRLRELTGSLLAPAVGHGLLNASAGLFVILLAGTDPLVAAPMGVVGALAIGLVAALAWLVPAPTGRADPSTPAPQALSTS